VVPRREPERIGGGSRGGEPPAVAR
jgi:hypothetical protein